MDGFRKISHQNFVSDSSFRHPTYISRVAYNLHDLAPRIPSEEQYDHFRNTFIFPNVPLSGPNIFFVPSLHKILKMYVNWLPDLNRFLLSVYSASVLNQLSKMYGTSSSEISLFYFNSFGAFSVSNPERRQL